MFIEEEGMSIVDSENLLRGWRKDLACERR